MAKPGPSYNARHYRGILYNAINDRIAKAGRWIVYARADNRFPCKCFDPNAGGSSIDTSCPLCFGTGFKTSLERIKVGFTYHPSFSPQADDTEIGIQDVFPATMTMRAQCYPKELDQVFETEWSVPPGAVASIGVPTRLLSAWRIKKILPIYTELSEVEFFGVGLEQRSLKLDTMQNILRAAGSNITTSAAMEGMTESQLRPSVYTPYSAGLGDRYPQMSSPDSYRSVMDRGLGRVSRKPRPGL